MVALLKDVLEPTLLQSLEGTPVFVHAGPFANIAHGCSSVISDDLALSLSEYVVTEAGFGADIGFEKFIGIKCRHRKLPDCATMVVTIRAIKTHSSTGDLKEGCDNMIKHIKNVELFGIPVVVAINKFVGDSLEDLETVKNIAIENGAFEAVVCENWQFGSKMRQSGFRAFSPVCYTT